MSRRELTKAELKTAANLKNIIKEKGYTQKQIASVMEIAGSPRKLFR